MRRTHLFVAFALFFLSASGETDIHRFAWAAVGVLTVWAFTQLLLAEHVSKKTKYLMALVEHLIKSPDLTTLDRMIASDPVQQDQVPPSDE